MSATLRITPFSAEPFTLRIGNTATIGRTKDNSVCLDSSPAVSRQHALIRCHDGYHYQLVDLGSRNGTFVDDARVITPFALADGARILVGHNLIVFEQTAADLACDEIDETIAGSQGEPNSTQKAVALLVCDVREFSSMAEKISSDHLAQHLGAWFRDAGNLVNETSGTIDKFIGDAILAYWSSPSTRESACDVALATAARLLALAENQRWANGEPFRVGIALHFGTVTCGNFGVDAQRDSTVIGDPVNTVFRLESVMKEIGRPLIFSDEFRTRLSPTTRCMDLGERMLKGKRRPVKISAPA